MCSRTYTNLINEGLDLYRAEQFWEGYELITANAGHTPRNEAQMYDFRASMACRAGRPQLALELLTEAVMEKGCWYTQEYLAGDDDIRTAAQLPGFQRIMEVCAERERRAREESTSELMMVRGGGEHPPLIVVLHGNMQNIPICQEDWGEVAEQGFDLAFVRSSQLAFSDAFVWNDLDVGARDLARQLDRLRAEGELEGRKVIMAGFSAGARMALRAVMAGLVKADSMVLVGPWLPEMGEWSSTVQALGGRMPGAYIICGDRDEECMPGARLLADTLELAGRPSHLHVAKGIGHYYPEGFADILSSAVSLVAAADKSGE